MKRRVGIAAIAALATVVATSAFAQTIERRPLEPVPDRNMNTFGVSAGVAIPGDDTLTNGLTLSVDGEHYFTPRLSARGMLTAAWWDIANAGDNNSVSPVAFDGNVVYNWEEGVWHPYATAGVGLYKYRFTENDVDSSDTQVSFNIGGGVEYFVTRRDTVTAEVLFHPLVGTVTSVNRTYTPWYWSISGGFKKYF
jgi:hypothetical protein